MSLHDLAVSRLRRLFPHSLVVRELDRKLSGCAQKACPFPAFRDGFCRGHLADAAAPYSVLPSALGVATIPQPQPHAHA